MQSMTVDLPLTPLVNVLWQHVVTIEIFPLYTANHKQGPDKLSRDNE